MQLTKLLTEDDSAVSPVIGVILMVAITVILAAVIASFVLGLGSQADQIQPTATFEFDYDSDADIVTVTHTNGDSILDTEVYIRGNDAVGNQGTWASTSGDANGDIGGESAVVSGDSTEIDIVDASPSGPTPNEYVLRVVWESSEGDTSAELASNRGPDA